MVPNDRLPAGERGQREVLAIEVIAQIEVAVREHGATVEELVVRLRSGAISQERFVAEMVSLRKAFERIVGKLTLEAKSSAFAAIASLKVPESQTRN